MNEDIGRNTYACDIWQPRADLVAQAFAVTILDKVQALSECNRKNGILMARMSMFPTCQVTCSSN